jgi:DNA-binding NtrC family response regulator
MKLKDVEVLVLDTKADRRELINQAILKHGGLALHVLKAEEGIKFLEHGGVGVFVTELHSRGLNAIDLLMHCKQFHKQIPVVVLFDGSWDGGVTTRDITVFGGIPVLAHYPCTAEWAESLIEQIVNSLDKATAAT